MKNVNKYFTKRKIAYCFIGIFIVLFLLYLIMIFLFIYLGESCEDKAKRIVPKEKWYDRLEPTNEEIKQNPTLGHKGAKVFPVYREILKCRREGKAFE